MCKIHKECRLKKRGVRPMMEVNKFKERAQVIINEKYALLSRLDEKTIELMQQSDYNMKNYLEAYVSDDELKKISERLDEIAVEHKYLMQIVRKLVI